jgi:hypothetical protein
MDTDKDIATETETDPNTDTDTDMVKDADADTLYRQLQWTTYENPGALKALSYTKILES